MNLDKQTKNLYKKLIQEAIIDKEKSDCLSFKIISPVASFCGVENIYISRNEYIKVLKNKLKDLEK
jgi:hypothetical protein